MNIITPDFLPAVPEIAVLTMICLILLVDVFLEDEHRAVTYYLSQATLILAGALTWTLADGGTHITFDGSFVNDPMAVVLKLFIYLITFFVFLYARDYLRQRNLFKGEFYVIGLLGMLGMMVMVSAHSLLTVYLGLELLALSQYALVAFRRDDARASEAAMKYFVLGALASGMLLYGMSMLYGVTGSLDIATIGQYITAAVQGAQGIEGDAPGLVLSFGLVFVVVGLAFKLGAVPFHMWVPDIYQGAPSAVTLYIGSAPKIAAFAMIMRLLVDALGGLHPHWGEMLYYLAVASMALGNLVAIAQTNLKRMLAYSTIAHVGFILMGLLTGTKAGYEAAMFYTLIYALMAAGGFGMITVLSRAGFEAENLDDLKGLNQRAPWLAAMMLLILFSMAGVPPLVGFYAKLAVLSAAIEAGLVGLAVIAVVFSIVGAYYYLRAVKLMYFDEPRDDAVIRLSGDTQTAISINGLSMLAIGLYPGMVMGLCVVAVGG